MGNRVTVEMDLNTNAGGNRPDPKDKNNEKKGNNGKEIGVGQIPPGHEKREIDINDDGTANGGNPKPGWGHQYNRTNYRVEYTYDITSEYQNVLMEYGEHYQTQKYTYGVGRISIDFLELDDHNNGWIPKTAPTRLESEYERLYYIKDELGSTKRLISEEGKVSVSYKYYDFGTPSTTTHFDVNWSGPDNTFGFTGYEWDNIAEMWYAKARYYDSDLGRFVAEDPLKGNIADIQSQNLYPYVRNNPLKYVDLDGREAVENNFLDYFGECFNDIKNHDEINDLLQQYIPNFDIRNITGTLVAAGAGGKVGVEVPKPPVITFEQFLKMLEKLLKDAKGTDNTNSALEKAILLTASFEGSGYVNVTGNFDGAGLSIGIFQWNIGQGTLQPMLKQFFDNNRDLAKQIFGSNYQSVVNMLAASKSTQMDWARSINNGEKLQTKWYKQFKALCETTEFQQIQRGAMEEYTNQAYNIANKYGLKSERGLALALDIAVQNWDVSATSRANIKNIIKNGATEQEILQLLAQAAVDKADSAYKADVRSRKFTIVNGTGTVHGIDYNLEKDYGITDASFK